MDKLALSQRDVRQTNHRGVAQQGQVAFHQAVDIIPQLEVAHDCLCNPLVVRRDDLAAVPPVHLVAVVLLGVVRGRHHHPARAAQQLHSEGHKGGRDQVAEEVHGDALRHQHRCGDAGKALRAVAPVIPCGGSPSECMYPSVWELRTKWAGKGVSCLLDIRH
eukprot:scaffold41839_cov29-Prasinocladus_malaysianus.AAC.1